MYSINISLDEGQAVQRYTVKRIFSANVVQILELVKPNAYMRRSRSICRRQELRATPDHWPDQTEQEHNRHHDEWSMPAGITNGILIASN